MNSRTQAFLLLLFGAALLRLATSDVLLRFVRASARPWVLIAGAVMLVLAIWSLIASARRRDDQQHSSEPAVDEHGHGPSRAAWLITLPVIAVLVVGPPALGAFTANRQSTLQRLPATQHFDALPQGDPVTVSVFDFAICAVAGGGTTLTRRSVSMVAFVTRAEPDGFVMARLVITCCAADATPIAVRVRSTTTPQQNRWVRVVGTYIGQDPHDPDLPVLQSTKVQQIAAPAQPYD